MNQWHIHRKWMGMLVSALILIISSTPLLNIAQQKAERNLVALRTKASDTENRLKQFRSDTVEIESMKEEINAEEAEKQLAPVDRLRAAQIIEHRAQESHLSHFTYSLSPEEKMSIDTVGAGSQELANSKLTLAADVPTDMDTSLFLDTIAHTLPGRLTLRHIVLHRINANGTAITSANIHMTIEAEWLSNGAAQNLAESTP